MGIIYKLANARTAHSERKYWLLQETKKDILEEEQMPVNLKPTVDSWQNYVKASFFCTLIKNFQ